MKERNNDTDNLSYKMEYDGRVFFKTRYNGIDTKTNQIVYEYRTEDDSRKLLMFKDGSFYKD